MLGGSRGSEAWSYYSAGHRDRIGRPQKRRRRGQVRCDTRFRGRCRSTDRMASSGVHARHVAVAAAFRDGPYVHLDHLGGGCRPCWQSSNLNANQTGEQEKRARNPYRPEATHPLSMRRYAVRRKTAGITVPCRSGAGGFAAHYPLRALLSGFCAEQRQSATHRSSALIWSIFSARAERYRSAIVNAAALGCGRGFLPASSSKV